MSGNTQTGYVLALAFGLVPSSRTAQLADKLVAKVAATGGHLSVGFLGVENLLPVLADTGHADTAYQILLQPGYPGWGYMISRGATTIWERWDGIRTDGSLPGPRHELLQPLRSRLGRRLPVPPGRRPRPGVPRLRVAARRPTAGRRPDLGASRRYETPYGLAVSDWSISAGALTLRVTVPAGASATVKVPTSQPGSILAPGQAVPSGQATFLLPAGSYTFTAPV